MPATRRARRLAGSALGVVVVGLAVLAVRPAEAFHAVIDDPNDTRGVLDVRRVQVRHDRVPHAVRVATFSGWTPAKIWDRGFVFVYLDTRYGSDPEHYVLIRSSGRRLLATLHTVRSGRRARELGPVKVWRPDGRSVAVNVPLERLLLGPARTAYRWWVFTLLIDGPCRRVCIDRGPNTGGVEQELPGPSPTPSPSPSPT